MCYLVYEQTESFLKKLGSYFLGMKAVFSLWLKTKELS